MKHLSHFFDDKFSIYTQNINIMDEHIGFLKREFKVFENFLMYYLTL